MMKHFLSVVPLLALLISCKEKPQPADETAWKIKGDSLVTRSFDTLRHTLLRAVGEKGFAGAVEFCNTEALSLTKAYSEEGIVIKRSTDKLRNPANAPDTMEQRIIAGYLQRKKENKEPEAIVEKDAAGNRHYFKPILVQTMCLNCHGDRSTQITTATREMIRVKYPDDAAYDYKEGDLRGTWHIIFRKEK